ncbi:MAG: cbb3-type cytochrome c oxidase subunit I [bacterium]|uniref:Cbb3-type cytochrome c oxidase subunit I n=1 Tax=Candidatus Methylomirabilis tolerans TaxID=3123416 RepID=A0AAJ1EJ83_9BACT|nr:cbb3-type cytochrome c oxidase subunit I [Candidatus Methylomirabilis sp.]
MILHRSERLSIDLHQDNRAHLTPTPDIEPAGKSASSRDLVRIARLPIHFFISAVVLFGLGVAAAPWVVGDLIDFFYQPRILAVTHTFTLGWISSAIMGVMYRLVPAMTKRPLRYPRLARWQFGLYLFSATGLMTHMLIGAWPPTWMAAAVIVLSVIFFAMNMLPCLGPAWHKSPAETGMCMSILFLLLAASLGTALALDKSLGFLPGNIISNLASHAHLAALGWVSLTICAVSYRMAPAFLLSELTMPRVAIWQLYSFAAGVLGLALSLLGWIPGAPVWSAVILSALLAYVGVLQTLVRNRRTPIDWPMRHALAGMVCLLLSIGLGFSLLWIEPDSAIGNRVAGTYGVLGLLGWVTNFIIGMSFKLFPGFVVGVRERRGWPKLAIAELALLRCRPVVFFSLNAGVLTLAGGLISAQLAIARLGTLVIAIGGLIYVAAMVRTLSYAYHSSAPPAASDPFRILSSDS